MCVGTKIFYVAQIKTKSLILLSILMFITLFVEYSADEHPVVFLTNKNYSLFRQNLEHWIVLLCLKVIGEESACKKDMG